MSYSQSWAQSLPVSNEEERRSFIEAMRSSPALFARIVHPKSAYLPTSDPFFAPKCYVSPIQDLDNKLDYFIDPASVLPVAALDVRPVDTVLDLCAAPGGKSILLASQLFFSGETAGGPAYLGVRMTANESSRQRFQRLQKNIFDHFPDRRGTIQVICSDATRSSSHIGRYGPYTRILVDAPCSSDRHRLHEGTLSNWSSASARGTVELQTSLLKVAIEQLGPRDSRLVYSTCSLNHAENDGVVEIALKKYNRVTVVDPERILTELNKKLNFGGTALSLLTEETCGEGWKLRRTKYGLLASPDKCQGCGPIFFAVLEKLKRNNQLG